jgi:uncharacterized protein (DUF2384 family)
VMGVTSSQPLIRVAKVADLTQLVVDIFSSRKKGRAKQALSDLDWWGGGC